MSHARARGTLWLGCLGCWMVSLSLSCGDDDGVAHGGDAAAAIDGQGGGDAPGGVDAPPGEACGGIAGLVCDDGQYCDYALNDCGAGDVQGTCQPIPTGCPDPISEDVCGCDGQIHSIPCDAYSAGTDVGPAEGCPPPSASAFPCGDRYCVEGATYCQITVSDVGGVPDDYRCVSWPTTCAAMGNAACGCFASEPCGALCEEPEADRFLLTCPGG